MLHFPGFGDIQPYKNLEIRIVSGLAPGLFPEMLNRTRGTFKLAGTSFRRNPLVPSISFTELPGIWLFVAPRSLPH